MEHVVDCVDPSIVPIFANRVVASISTIGIDVSLVQEFLCGPSAAMIAIIEEMCCNSNDECPCNSLTSNLLTKSAIDIDSVALTEHSIKHMLDPFDGVPHEVCNIYLPSFVCHLDKCELDDEDNLVWIESNVLDVNLNSGSITNNFFESALQRDFDIVRSDGIKKNVYVENWAKNVFNDWHSIVVFVREM